MSDSNKNPANLEESKKETNNVGILIGSVVVILAIVAYVYTMYYYPSDKKVPSNTKVKNPLRGLL
jgi:flagellar basal body-associated protein FliL